MPLSQPSAHLVASLCERYPSRAVDFSYAKSLRAIAANTWMQTATMAGATSPSEQSPTRPIFEAFSSRQIAFFYLVAWSCIAIFIYGVFVQIRKYRRGTSPVLRGSALGRMGGMLASILSHRSVARRDRGAGTAHRLIFYGFLFLFIGTAIITLEYDIVEPLLGVTFWRGDFYLVYSLVLDLAGIGLIVGLGYMMLRRGWIRPPKLDYRRPNRSPQALDFDRHLFKIEDWSFLWLLLAISMTGFILEAARLVWLQDRQDVWEIRWWSPGGAILAEAMRASNIGVSTAGALRVALWWLHGFIALVGIALIPWTKAKHMFTTALSIYLRDPLAKSRLSVVQADAPTSGVSLIDEFNWKQLVQFDACTKCGRCHEVCPANLLGMPLSPRDLVLSLAEKSASTLESFSLPGNVARCVHGSQPGQVSRETLWSCMTCNACVEICPVGIEHVPAIVDLRRSLVDAGDLEPLLGQTLETIDRTGNSFGNPGSSRGQWARDLSFKIKDARKEPVELLWFVGDFASFDPRNQEVSLKFAKLLQAAGIDFGLLFEGELNAGNDVRRVGEEGLFEKLSARNIAAFRSASFQSIVTTDPHSYNTIRNEYPDFGLHLPIEHYTSVLLRLVKEEKLEVVRPAGLRATFHDPCHLGRYNGGYEPPRELLELFGYTVVEMPRNRDNSFCCGAGGGKIWMPDPVGVERPSQNRMREAAEIDDLDVFVVSCPKDLVMYEDALKSTGNDRNFAVRELIEIASDVLVAARNPESKLAGASETAQAAQ